MVKTSKSVLFTEGSPEVGKIEHLFDIMITLYYTSITKHPRKASMSGIWILSLVENFAYWKIKLVDLKQSFSILKLKMKES